MTKITPEIIQIKMPMPLEDESLSHTNAYLIRGTDGFLLVDSGWNTDKSLDALEECLAEFGANISDISQIVLTHVHPDHYGMAGRVKKLSGATTFMHEIEIGFITPRYISMDELLHQTDNMLVANGVPHDVMVRLRDATVGLEQYIDTTFPDVPLHHGEIITHDPYTFHVVWTPGHSPGHICLYEPEKKILLSGDHILPTITPNISVNPLSLDNPLGRYIQSLQEVRQLDIDLVLPGHDEPFNGLKERIDEIIRHHDQRNQQILTAMAGNARTGSEVAGEIPWGSGSTLLDLPDFHKRMAIFETLSHLEMMATDDILDRFSQNDIIYYKRR